MILRRSELKKSLNFQKYEYNMFQIFMKMFIVSRETGNKFTKGVILSHTLILFISIVHIEEIFEVKPLSNSILFNAIIFVIISINVIYLATMAWFTKNSLSVSTASSSTVDTILRIMTYINDSYSMIITPLMALSVGKIDQNTVIWMKVVFYITLGICVGISFISLVFGRNTFLTKNGFSSLNTDVEIIVNYILVIMVFLTSNLPKSSMEHPYIIIIENVIFFLVLMTMSRTYMFWDASVNLFYSCCMSVVFISKIYSDREFWKTLNIDSSSMKISAVMLSIAFVCKIMQNFNESFPYIDFLKPGQSYIKIKYALTMYQSLQEKSLEKGAKITQKEIRILMHYRGIMSNHMNKCKKVNCYCNEMKEGRSLQITFEKFLKNKSTEKKEFLKLYLEFQIVGLAKNLFMFRSYLVYLSRNSKSIIQKFQLYHIQKLFSLSLHCIKDEKSKENKITNTLSTLYEDLFSLARKEPPVDRIDVGFILEIKDFYKSLTSKVLLVLKETSSMLLKVENEQDVSSKDIYFFNEKIMNVNKEIKKDSQKQFQRAEIIPTYVYGLLTFYFACVRNEVKLGKNLFKTYKQKLKKWMFISLRIEEIEQDNLLLNSVLFKVSIDAKSSGEIIDYSADYSTYLGEGPNKNLKGTNINNLIPFIFQTQHKKMMRRSNKIMKIMNLKRSCFITGYDGFLRRVQFIMKVSPMLRNDICLFMYLRVININDSCVVLVDKSQEIFSGNKIFWDIVDKYKEKEKEITHVDHISYKITEDIREVTKNKKTILELIKAKQKLEEDQDKRNHEKGLNLLPKKKENTLVNWKLQAGVGVSKVSEFDTEDRHTFNSIGQVNKKLEKCQQNVKKFLNENSNTGKPYWIEEDSPLFDSMNKRPFYLKMQTDYFGNDYFYILQFKFDSCYFDNQNNSSISSGKSSKSSWMNRYMRELGTRDNQMMETKLPLHKWDFEEFPEENIVREERMEMVMRSTVRDYHPPSSFRKRDFQEEDFPYKNANVKEYSKSARYPIAQKFSTIQEDDAEYIPSPMKKKRSPYKGKRVNFMMPQVIEGDEEEESEKKINKTSKLTKKSKTMKLKSVTRKSVMGKPSMLLTELVSMKMTEEREMRRKIQRSKDQMSIVLASSNFLENIMNVVSKTAVRISRFGGKVSKDNMGSSISSQAFNTKLDRSFILDSALSRKKKFELFWVLMGILSLFLLVFSTTLAYYYLQIYSLYEYNIEEFRIVSEMSHLDIAMGYSFLDSLELSTYTLAEDKSVYSGITDDLFDELNKMGNKTLNMVHEVYDTLLTNIGKSNSSMSEPAIHSLMTKSVIGYDLVKSEPLEFETNTLFLISIFTQNIKMILQTSHLLNFHKSNMNEKDLRMFKRDIKREIYSILTNGPTFFKKARDYLQDFNKRILNDLWSQYNFRLNVYVIYYITGILVSFFSLIYILNKYENFYLHLASSYFNLTTSEISFQIKLNESYIQLLEKNRFHEEKILKQYAEQPYVIGEIEETQKIDKGYMNRISRKKDIKHTSLFPSVWKTCVCGFLLVIWFIIFLVLSLIFDSFQIRNIELERVAFKVMEGSMAHKSTYLSVIADTLFDDAFLIEEKSVKSFEINEENLDFVSQFIDNEKSMMEIFDEATYNKISSLVTGDECTKMTPSFDFWGEVCENLNSGVMKQGLLNFFYYQKDSYKTIRKKLESLEGRNYTIRGTEVFENKALDSVWLSKEFIELRLGYNSGGHYFISQILNIILMEQEKIKNTIETYTNSLFMSYNILVSIFLLVFMTFTSKHMSKDQTIVTETFRIIHPRNILNNAYILNKLKKNYNANMLGRL